MRKSMPGKARFATDGRRCLDFGSATLSKEDCLSATASFLIFIPGMTILSFLIGAIIMTVALSDNVEPEDDEAIEAPAAH